MKKTLPILLALATTVAAARPSAANWEVGARGVVDSNVLRAQGGDRSDPYLSAYLSYSRAPENGNRLDWLLGASVEGALYREVTELSYGAVAVSAALRYDVSSSWTLSAGPFVQARAAHEGGLSALAWGGRIGVEQRLGTAAYAGEYYRYTDSGARDEAFSYTENLVGAYFEYEWSPSLWSEIGYTFSRGESLRTAGFGASGDGMAHGRMGGGGSMAGGQDVGSLGGLTRVESHELTATVGYGWTPASSTYLGYAFGRSTGGFGSEDSHAAFVGSVYRF